MRSGTTQRKMCIKFRFQSYLKRFLGINYELTTFQGRVVKKGFKIKGTRNYFFETRECCSRTKVKSPLIFRRFYATWPRPLGHV